ncbi:hypothetical protein CDAR_116681 [Caerostris darwini]|uniref:LAGLIDADG homing endonuclease n=1 Tax=Caerostris darwini TaxID=1538125 RepID=A0AAV4QZ67_9ARAC|nr:hypothetical protein CDAR_116681 [Caerostris darwini]
MRRNPVFSAQMPSRYFCARDRGKVTMSLSAYFYCAIFSGTELVLGNRPVITLWGQGDCFGVMGWFSARNGENTADFNAYGSVGKKGGRGKKRGENSWNVQEHPSHFREHVSPRYFWKCAIMEWLRPDAKEIKRCMNYLLRLKY